MMIAVAQLIAAASAMFDFGGLGTQGDISFQTQGLEKCVGNEVEGSCALSMKSFGGTPILHSIVTIKERRLQSLIIHAAAADYAQVVDAFTAKYGRSSNSDVFPIRGSVANGVKRMQTWTFADGVLVVQQSDDKPQLSVLFGSNRKLAPKVDF